MAVNPKIFKAYDIRGIFPTEWDENQAREIGRALVDHLGCQEVAVGRDMRTSSDAVFAALSEGITMQGASVVDLGKVSTDGLYFAVGKYGYQAGVMITASHNPKEYNGLKICQKDAIPLSGDQGLNQMRDLINQGKLKDNAAKGSITARDISKAYISHCLTFIDPAKIKPYRIAVDAGNGMAGQTVPPLFAKLPGELVPLFFELDGSFPNHPASPIEPENISALQGKVVAEKCDFGAAFDGDADRMFLIDEKGRALGGSDIAGLVAKMLLKKKPGSTVLYNAICSRCVPETVARAGGKSIRSRVGHALIKPLMRQENAIFGGEHSGHFYFRDFWFADSGLIAFLVCWQLISEEGKPLSELVAEIDPYHRISETNSQVEDIPAKLAELESIYQNKGAELDHLDGLTVSYKDWWANIRPSNTEPLLRLNVEANSRALLEDKTAELLNIIRS
ncbi:MAG: phosphomannomutase/phosphoglucomutase [Candidatus Edwardsbacteria bacterium]|nr:phosphomannomutase/phosphoglucomutase [Candidatus Edwardsbacteria bacterium]